MFNVTNTFGKGAAFGLNPIHHRWDKLSGVNVITFFTDTGDVLGPISEVEHRVQAVIAACNASVRDNSPILESVKWVGKWGAFMNSTQPSPPDTFTESCWLSLPSALREASEAERVIVAAAEFIRTLQERTAGLTVEEQVEARLRRYQVSDAGLVTLRG